MNLDKAIRLAVKAHAGQVDKQGRPYILHPLRVMLKVAQKGENEVIQGAAVLHDVLEDTDVTAEELKKELGGGPDQDLLMVYLRRLTRKDGVSYTDYIVGVSQSHATDVKLADLEDNLALDRILLRPEHLEQDLARIKKYLLSYKFLKGELSEEQYRSLMGEKND